MPELPEVETIKNTLQQNIAGLTITDVQVNLPKLIRQPDPADFVTGVVNSKITSIQRRGKYLLLHLDMQKVMVVHLRMTGQLVYVPQSHILAPHTHLIFQLNNYHQLRYTDIRQFGTWQLVLRKNLNQVKGLKDLGPEPLSDDFTKGYLRRQLKGKRARIKSVLLDQTFLAGLGNIYADESLHRAGLHPERLACTISPREAARLYQGIVTVLQEAIAGRGTSMRDYVDGEGNTGNFQNLLQVYNRQGQCCHNCGHVIDRIKVGGRSSYHCPGCQKQ